MRSCGSCTRACTFLTPHSRYPGSSAARSGYAAIRRPDSARDAAALQIAVVIHHAPQGMQANQPPQ